MPSRRLRVLFLASYFPKPDNPWMGTWALAQAEALARQNIELLVVSFTSWVPTALALTRGAKAYADCPEEYVWFNSVRVRYPRWLYYPVPPLKAWAYTHPTPYLQLAAWSAQRELCRIVEAFQPDVIFCHHMLPNGWIAAQLPDRLRRPIVTLDHDFDEIRDCQIHERRRTAMQTVADRAWAMLAVSNPMQQDLQRLFPDRLVLTHHNGVELPSQTEPRPIALQNKKIVLACALFAERKGIPFLIEAFCQIAAQHPTAILRIIGSGPEEGKIRQTVQQYDATAQVQLIGKKPHSEVLQEMAWSDCFALVGWNEPFATVYLEAMAAGKPIICCNDGGINDVVVNEVHGYVVAPKNLSETAIALDRILSDDAKRIEMGHQARSLIEQQLTWDVKAAELVELLQRAASGRNRAIAVQV